MNGSMIAELIRRVLEEKVRVEGTTGKGKPGLVTTADIEHEIRNFHKTKRNHLRPV